MMIKDGELQRLQDLTDDALLGELGRAVLKSSQRSLGGRAPKLSELGELARAWLADERDRIEALICKSESIRELVESEPELRAKLVRVIGDVLSTVYTGFPCATVAEILLRDGIKQFCNPVWSD